jgi:hypothetical protein
MFMPKVFIIALVIATYILIFALLKAAGKQTPEQKLNGSAEEDENNKDG